MAEMIKKLILIAAAAFALFLLQTSFAPHFPFFAGRWFEWANFITLPAVLFALFERRRHNLGWGLAVLGGFLLDIYSARFFGFWIIVLSFAVLAIKLGIKKYVRIPSLW